MAYLPPVKLETHTSWFDILLTVLHEHAESDPYEEYREMAQRLIQHFMAHGRSFTDGYQKECVVPFPVSWTVKMKKKQKETQDILSYHTQAAGCSDKARAKASGGRQPIEECGRTGL